MVENAQENDGERIRFNKMMVENYVQQNDDEKVSTK